MIGHEKKERKKKKKKRNFIHGWRCVPAGMR